ncbi:zf-UBR-domain-containing protein, partial [Hanseniaspora valbyensis NRRL Y-1626]
HSGRNCGKGFNQGQPIYRCQECGMDDTCVLCFRCFNPNDHIGHHIMVHTTDDNTSGICDCGDGDAWKSELHCNAD